MTCHRDKVRKTVGKVLKPRIPPYFLKPIVHKKSIKKLPLHAAVFIHKETNPVLAEVKDLHDGSTADKHTGARSQGA